MDTETFLDEVLSRVKIFLDSSQSDVRIRSEQTHDSLLRTSDLKLPMEGRGLESALDDIESLSPHYGSWLHESVVGRTLHHLRRR